MFGSTAGRVLAGVLGLSMVVTTLTAAPQEVSAVTPPGTVATAEAAPSPVTEGQLPGGTSLSVGFDTTAGEAGVRLDGTVALGEGDAVPDTTLLYVMDISGSTILLDGCGGEQNADGHTDTVLDCQVAAAIELNNAAVDSGVVKETGVVVFAASAAIADVGPAAGRQVLTSPPADADGRGGRDVDEVLRSVYTGGFFPGVRRFTSQTVSAGTNFDAGLVSTCNALAASTTGNQVVAFLSDGESNRGRHVSDALTCGSDVTIHTFAVGAAAGCDSDYSGRGSLQDIADLTGGTCTEVVEDVADLPNVLPGVARSRVTRLEATVDGGDPVDLSATTDPALPAEGPVSISFEHLLDSLGSGEHQVCVTAHGRDVAGEGSVTHCATVQSNQPPVADAGDDVTVDEGGVVSLDGTASTDPDGDPLTYAWTLLEQDGAPVSLTSPTSAAPSFLAPDDGTYAFGLTVSDGQESATDTVTVTVANGVPVVTADVDAGYAGGVTLATASFTDPGWLDVHSATVDFGDGSDPLAAPVTAGAGWGTVVASHVYARPGSYAVTITVVDKDGGTGTADAATVDVAEPVALWAGSTTAPLTLDWSGGGGAVTGRVHSNHELRVRGATKSVTGATTYAHSISADTDRHVFSVVPARAAVEVEPPVAFALADYRPGGRAALDAGEDYHDVSAQCGSAGTWHVNNTVLEPGLYYADCDVLINGSDIGGGGVSVVAEGSLEVAGTRPAFEPYADGLLFLAGGTRLKVSASSSKFLGFVTAPAGAVEVSGNENRFSCGIVADTITISGSGFVTEAVDCSRPERTVAASLLVPSLEVGLAADADTAVPGDTVTHTVEVTNTGSRLVLPGVVGAENMDTSTATLAHWSYQVEYLDVAEQRWVSLAGAAGTTDGYVPLDPPARSEGVTLTATPNATGGVTYPAGDDLLTGTTLEPGSLASWGYQAVVDLTPAQVAVLLDEQQSAAVRHSVVLEFTPETTQVRRLYRFGHDVVGELRAQGASAQDVQVTVLRPEGDALSLTSTEAEGLAAVGPGATATTTAPVTVAVPAARGDHETSAAYLARLAATDGAELRTFAFARATAGVGLVIAPQGMSSLTSTVPVVGLSSTADATSTAGAVLTYDLGLSNTGGAEALALGVTHTVGGEPVDVPDVPATLQPGGVSTLGATFAVPHDHDGGVVQSGSTASWQDANGNGYGPVDAASTTTVQSAGLLVATQSVTVQDDADGSGLPSPGDTLRYRATLTNRGGSTVTGVRLDVAPDPHTTLVAGAVTTSHGTVSTGNASGDTTVSVLVGDVTGGTDVGITYDVRVTDPFPEDARHVEAQGTVSADGLPELLTDDPTRPGSTDPTRTQIIVPVARLTATMTSDLVLDADGDGVPGAGDTLEYEVFLHAEGNAPVEGARLEVRLDPHTGLVADSVRTTQGTVQEPPAPEEGTAPPDVLVDLGTLEGLTTATVTFRAQIVDPLPAGVTSVSAQGVVHSDTLEPVSTTDPRAVDGGSTTTPIAEEPAPVIPGPLFAGTSLTDGAVVTEPLEVRALVTPPDGEDLVDWVVSYRRASGGPEVELASGPWPAEAAAAAMRLMADDTDGADEGPLLAVFDPTVLPNGTYVVTVAVTASGGGTTTSETGLVVDGQLKPGRYVATFEDLNVEVGGLPLSVRRTYDSFDAVGGDFGPGWSLDVASVTASTARPLGQSGWGTDVHSCALAFCIVDYTTDVPHVVTVTWPDGRQELFDLTPAPGSNILPFFTSARYTAREGSTSTLRPVAGDSSLFHPGDGNLYAGMGYSGVYDPHRFEIEARDGTAYLVDRDLGLLSVTDPQGRTLTLGEDGLVSSEGPTVEFARDGAGRITGITAPDGSVTGYGYTDGRLTSVTDPTGSETTFGYDAAGLLQGITDGLGNAFQTLEYDADGRLVAVTDATGARTAVSVDIGARTETVTDAEGRLTTVSTLDERGNLLRQDHLHDGRTDTTTWEYDDLDNAVLRVDPEGAQWRAAYDGRDVTQITDPRGAATVVTYDDSGRPLTWTDPDGRVTAYQWNDDGTLASIVDPDGNPETYAYANGNQTGMTKREGGTWTYGYDSAGRQTSETDPLGNTRTWAYDAAGRVTVQTDALGGRTVFAYDDAGRMVSETDPTGASTVWTYDAAGQVLAETDPEGHSVRWEYDAAGRVTAQLDPLGATTGFTYDRNGRVVAETAPTGGVTSYGYDGLGQLVSLTDPLDRETGYAYDGTGRLVREENPAGGVTSYGYDAAGHLLEETDPAGGVTTSTYSPAGLLLSTTDPLGRETTYTYDAAGRRTSTTWPDGTTTSQAYDRDGHLVSSTDETGALTTTAYDAAGRAVSSTDPLGRVSTYVFDAAGRTAKVTDPLGNATTYTYDAAGRMTGEISAEGVRTAYELDRRGLVTATTDGAGHVTRTGYDAAGRPVVETDALGRATTTTYDTGGRVVAITDALEGSVTFGYDAAGQQTTLTDANGRTWTTAYGSLGQQVRETDPLGRARTWAYDTAGRLTSSTDGRGVTVTRDYDAAGRLLSQGHPAGAISYTYDLRGRRLSATEGPATTRWAYDPAGRITEVVTPQGAVGYSYDAAGQRLTMTQPQGEVRYSYDAAGRVVALTGLDGAVTTLTYDGDSRPVGISRPNGVTTTQAYDGAGRLVSVAHTGGGVSESFDYTLDAVGNRVAVESSAGTETYVLDALNRLVRADLAGGEQVAYTYDPAGNRLSETRDGATTAYSYDAAGQLLAAGGDTFGYDAAGHRTSAGSDTFDWDWAGRLVAADVSGVEAAYGYDADGVRVSSQVDGAAAQELVYDRAGGLPTLISDGETGYVHAAGGPLAAVGDTSSYLLGDGLGSVRATTDAAGAVTSTMTYDPFGERTVSGAGSVFGFTGQMQDGTGLVHLRARDLDPLTGAMLSIDPVRPGAPGVVGYNQYAYVGSNPTSWTDPTGMFASGEYGLSMRIAVVPAAATATSQVSLGKILELVFASLVVALVTQQQLSGGSRGDTRDDPTNPSRPPRTNPSPPLPGPGGPGGGGAPPRTDRDDNCNAPVGMIGTYRDLSRANRGTGHLCHAHHIVQHAAVKGYVPGYTRGDASAIILTVQQHFATYAVQRTPGRGTLGAEKQIAKMALRAAGMRSHESAAMAHVGQYFNVTLRAPDSTRTKVFP
ncbi:PKD domain-containing protein [Ornithinimicrobium cavernae]|uniref:PKD domain-containing protein n=1 Tax=Ornithinimicrobium cavernae TaxID=2666047 RepID=UPI000D6923CE|nr:PKD domain-containing protein [Ornithinimicrobium cavernae]